MKIYLLRIINFKQYFGEQKIRISDSKEHNITVFHGANGTGKTSLFSAINWCLYGLGEEGVGELLNKRAIIQAEMGEEIQLVVTVCFTHENEDYMAEKVYKYLKDDKTHAKLISKDFFLTVTDLSGNCSTISNPIGKMNSILPKNVREYFFFDGENMDDLTRPDNEKIENAITNIMRLPIIDKTFYHLDIIANGYRREIKRRGSTKVSLLITEEENLENQLITCEKRREELLIELRKGKTQISDLEKVLKENEKSKELQEKRELLQESFNNQTEQLGSNISQIQSNVVQLYPLLLSKQLHSALKIVNEKREKGEIPSGLKEQFIKDLIERDICICGRRISETQDAKEYLFSLISNPSTTKFEDRIMRMPGDISGIHTVISKLHKNLLDLCKQKIKIEASLEDLDRRIDEISRQLEGSENINIVQLEKKLSKFKANQTINEKELQRNLFQIENLQKKIEEKVKEREKEEKKQKELKILSRKEELSRKASEAVLRIKKEFYEQTRIRIEEETKKVFSELAWKHDQFQDIRLDPDFHLEIIDRWGLPSREEISAGERQILSLAFICAMVKLSGEEAPIIMDTPFGRLSSNHLDAVAKSLPELLPQLILMVTDREWNTASKSKLEPYVGEIYNLVFDESTGCTKIKEVSFV